MKSNTRGQMTGFPVWPGAVIVVAVTIFVVGQNIVDAMQSQLPSGDIVLCGGACGAVLNMMPIAFFVIFGLVLLFWQVGGIHQR